SGTSSLQNNLILSKNQRQSAYERLLHKPSDVNEAELARLSQSSRFDPRLAEILVRFISENYQRFNPWQLNKELTSQQWPAAFGVLSEFVKSSLTKQKKIKFSHWRQLALTEIRPAPFQMFFIGVRAPGGKLMVEDAI